MNKTNLKFLPMKNLPINLILADDDEDDCLFFKEALNEIQLDTSLTTANDGVELMEVLSKKGAISPHVLFLDLNMPRKNGLECLLDIKRNKKFKQLPIIIFSTSADKEIVNQLHQSGAHYYIRKPVDFSQLKKVIHQALIGILENHTIQPSKEDFELTGEIRNP